MSRLFKSISHARIYAAFRPIPPKPLINEIIHYLKQNMASNQLLRAVDVGCGSGQCTTALSPHFREVYGFDISNAQISEALHSNQLNNVLYKVSSAENIPLESNSVQLLTVSQALHWFDLEKFYNEVNRLLTCNGVLALIGYYIPYISHPNFPNDERLLNFVNNFYKSPLLLWSKKERQIVDEGYASITLPYEDRIRKDCFSSHSTASATDLKGYLMSWSGFNTLKEKDEEKATIFLTSFDDKIRTIFGDIEMDSIEFEIHYNFFLLMGRKPDVR